MRLRQGILPGEAAFFIYRLVRMSLMDIDRAAQQIRGHRYLPCKTHELRLTLITCRAICITPLISHKENGVHGGGNGGIVVGFIEKTALRGGGFGSQGSPDEITLSAEEAAEAGEKFRIGCGEGGGKKFKIHIDSRKALIPHELLNTVDQTVLSGLVRQDQGGAGRVELLVFRIGGKVQNRAGTMFPGGEKKLVVLQGKKTSVRRDPVGKGRKIGQIRRDGIQQQAVDEGVGVAVESGGADGRLLVGNHDVHSLGQSGKTTQTPVVLIEAADGDAIVGGDGGERVPGSDGMDEFWKADDQSLSHGESASGGDLIIRGEPEGIDTVRCGNGIHGFADVYHMDSHLNIPPCREPMRDRRGICAKRNRCAITAVPFCERGGQMHFSSPVKLVKWFALYEKKSRCIGFR